MEIAQSSIRQAQGLPGLLHHYLELFRRKKAWLILSGILATAASVYCILSLDLFNQARPATVLIGMDRPLQASVGNDADDMGPKKIELIRSRNFLQQVVTDLSLCLRTRGDSRDNVFDSIFIGPEALPGGYRLRVIGKTIRSVEVLSRGPFGAGGRTVFRSKVEGLKALELPGLFLRLDDKFLGNPRNIAFSLITPREAIDNILDNLTIERPTGRRENYFTITLIGRDYPLITRVVNALADKFVKQNLGFGKRRLHERLEMLGKQLALARNQLAVSENGLRDFLTMNPTFALDKQTEQAVGDLVQQESQGMEMENALNDAVALQNQLKGAQREGRTDITNEILMLLASKNVIRASVLQSELSRLISEREALERAYAKDHPLLLANQRKIDDVAVQSGQALGDFIQDMLRDVTQKKAGVVQLSSKLRNLPQKSLRLAELRRQQQIDSESYSLLMSRYNQAKVEDAVEISDVFVMDYAVEPLAFPPAMKWIMTVALGLFFGLLLSFGPVVFLDGFRRTAHSEMELLRLTDLPALESIPRLHPSKADNRPHNRKIPVSPLLITEGVFPIYAKEVFRSLRTKVLLALKGSREKSVIITSMESGAGKTMVAANQAITLAQHGLKTLVADGDLRRGTLHDLFGLKRSPGLSEYLAGEKEDGLPGWIQGTHVPGLFVMSSGEPVADTSELITPARMGRFLDSAFKMFDVVILDAPPLGVAADAAVVHEKFASFLIVVKAGVTNLTDLNNKIAEYPPVRGKIIGAVLNQVNRDLRFKYYKSSPYVV